MQITKDSKDNILKAIQIIVNSVNSDKIILFGSRARNDFKEESDYDLLIIKDEIHNKRKIIQQVYKKLLGLKIGIDLIIETSQEFNEKKSNKFS